MNDKVAVLKLGDELHLYTLFYKLLYLINVHTFPTCHVTNKENFICD